MKSITRIVITGGPCGGKSTAVKRARIYFEEQGYKVLVVQEAATILIGGGLTPDLSGMPYFQSKVMRTQIEMHRIFDRVAEDLDSEKVLILYDRGIMDGNAYLDNADFDLILEQEKLTRSVVLDYYDAVFYMMSAAKSCPDEYTLSNNSARREDVEKAAVLDERTALCWRDHPHFVCIKGEADFEKKIQNLLDAITAFINKN